MATYLRCLGRYQTLKLLTNSRAALSSVSDKIHPDWVLSGGAEHPAFKKIDLNFQNIKEAYKSKSNSELARALLVLRLCTVEDLVAHQKSLFSLGEKVLGRTVLEKVLQETFYAQFVAGPDIPSIKPVIQRYRKYGVKSILDYSAETDVGAQKEHSDFITRIKILAAAKADASPLIRQYRAPVPDLSKGVIHARTYPYENEKVCDNNMRHFIECIDAVAETTEGTGFAAVKVTALGKPELLMHVSEVLVRMEDYCQKLTAEGTDVDSTLRQIGEYHQKKGLHRQMGIPASRDSSKQWLTWVDITNEGRIDLFDWKNLLKADIRKILALPSSKTQTDSLGRKINLLVPVLGQVDPAMEELFRSMLKRLNKVVEHAESRGVRIMIDAEQTYFQPAIDRLAVEMMRQFNKKKPVVFNTFQAYTRDSLPRAQRDLALAAREDFYYGAKLVRGAYIEQERARAAELKYPDPIWSNTNETTANYVKIFDEFMKQARMRPRGKVSVIVASHNEESVRYAVLKMKELGINPEDEIVSFGQLMGMCDQVSFSLGQAGFSIYKYVPYGPTFEVMPYLMRRAQENSSIFAKVAKERKLIQSELHRRIKAGDVWHDPK